jgi:hypothetical protein
MAPRAGFEVDSKYVIRKGAGSAEHADTPSGTPRVRVSAEQIPPHGRSQNGIVEYGHGIPRREHLICNQGIGGALASVSRRKLCVGRLTGEITSRSRPSTSARSVPRRSSDDFCPDFACPFAERLHVLEELRALLREAIGRVSRLDEAGGNELL